MRNHIVIILVVLAALLAGCQRVHHINDPLLSKKSVTPGSTFAVVKPFLIPSGDSSVYFQDTQLYPQGEIQPDFPYCQFLTGSATADGEVIKEQTLTVVNVEYDEKRTGARGMVGSSTEFHLQSASSKKTYRMNCLLPVPSKSADFISPVEIEGVLGGYMELKVAP